MSATARRLILTGFVLCAVALITAPSATAETSVIVAQDSTAPQGVVPTEEVWDRVALCETGANWTRDDGSGISGGLGIVDRTWELYGGTEFAPTPALASRDQQILIANRIWQIQGWPAWPRCADELGLVPPPTTAAPTTSGPTTTVDQSDTTEPTPTDAPTTAVPATSAPDGVDSTEPTTSVEPTTPTPGTADPDDEPGIPTWLVFVLVLLLLMLSLWWITHRRSDPADAGYVEDDWEPVDPVGSEVAPPLIPAAAAIDDPDELAAVPARDPGEMVSPAYLDADFGGDLETDVPAVPDPDVAGDPDVGGDLDEHRRRLAAWAAEVESEELLAELGSETAPIRATDEAGSWAPPAPPAPVEPPIASPATPPAPEPVGSAFFDQRTSPEPVPATAGAGASTFGADGADATTAGGSVRRAAGPRDPARANDLELRAQDAFSEAHRMSVRSALLRNRATEARARAELARVRAARFERSARSAEDQGLPWRGRVTDLADVIEDLQHQRREAARLTSEAVRLEQLHQQAKRRGARLLEQARRA